MKSKKWEKKKCSHAGSVFACYARAFRNGCWWRGILTQSKGVSSGRREDKFLRPIWRQPTQCVIMVPISRANQTRPLFARGTAFCPFAWVLLNFNLTAPREPDQVTRVTADVTFHRIRTDDARFVAKVGAKTSKAQRQRLFCVTRHACYLRPECMSKFAKLVRGTKHALLFLLWPKIRKTFGPKENNGWDRQRESGLMEIKLWRLYSCYLQIKSKLWLEQYNCTSFN